MGHLMSLKALQVPTALLGKKVWQAVLITLYYKEAIVGSRVKNPPETFKDPKVLVFAASVPSKQVALPTKKVYIRVAVPNDEVTTQITKSTTDKEVVV